MASSSQSNSNNNVIPVQITYQYFGRGTPKDIILKFHREIRSFLVNIKKSTIHTNNNSSNTETPNSNVRIKVQTKMPINGIGYIQSYDRIFIHDLISEYTHTKKLLRVKIIERPVVFEGLHLIVQDLNEDCIQVFIKNSGITDHQIADKVFQIGYELCVFNPYLKSFFGAQIGVVLDDPKLAYVGPLRPDYENINIHQHASQAFERKNFELARKFYTQALKSSEEVAKIIAQIVACLQKQSTYHACQWLFYAYSSVRIDEFCAEGWLGVSQALKKLDFLHELESVYKFAPCRMQPYLQFNYYRYQQQKNKNISSEVMQSFLFPQINIYIPKTNNHYLEGSFTELKEKGDEFFSKNQFSRAQDFYQSAVDTKKYKISALLLKRAECFFGLGNYLEAAIDASTAIVLQNENNEQAIFLRASALRELGRFEDAKQFILSEINIVVNSSRLKYLLSEMDTIGVKKFPNLKNIFFLLHTSKIQTENSNEIMSADQLKLLQSLKIYGQQNFNAWTVHAHYDLRVPNFLDEYFKGGYLPSQCDEQECENWLLTCYQESIIIGQKLQLDKIQLDMGGVFHYRQLGYKFVCRRLGIGIAEGANPARVAWWLQSCIGNVNLIDRPGGADPLYGFQHVWEPPLDLEYGCVHVGVRYIDFGQLLMANIRGKESAGAIQFVGYESTYCTAKAGIICKMMCERVDPKIILQVWYSSGWSFETLSQFRTTVAKQIKEDRYLGEEIKSLLRYWLAVPRVSLLETQKIWLKYHPHHCCLPANMLQKKDRMEMISYMLTGRLLECDVGSVLMFVNPYQQPLLSLNERITCLLQEKDVLKTYQKYGGVLNTFIGQTLERINWLSEMLCNNKIVISLRHHRVTPDDGTIHQEIRDYCPRSINWSNIVDVWGIEKFHKMAKSCSASENTMHFVNSVTWHYDVKGAMVLDFPFEVQYKFYNDICAEFLQGGDRGQGILLVPPIDNPWNLCDAQLSLESSKLWAKKFYELGGVLRKNVSRTISYPYSIFARAQGVCYLKYSYDKNRDFFARDQVNECLEKQQQQNALVYVSTSMN